MRESRELNIRQSSVDKLEIDENVADFLLLWATDGENDRVTGARRDNLSIGFNQSISIFIVPYFRMITFRSAVEIRQLLVMVARSSFSKSEYHNKSSEALLGKGLQNKQKRHEAFDSPTPHFLREGAHPGGYDPQIRTWPRFLYSAPTPKFHHPMFTRSEVIVLINKQTNRRHWKHPTLLATLRRWANSFSLGIDTSQRQLLGGTSTVQFEVSRGGAKLWLAPLSLHWLALFSPHVSCSPFPAASPLSLSACVYT